MKNSAARKDGLANENGFKFGLDGRLLLFTSLLNLSAILLGSAARFDHDSFPTLGKSEYGF